MRQALHIFKKDVRHLWFEMAVVITVVAAFTFTGARRAQWLADPVTNRIAAWTLVLILLPLAWWTLIARVIHDEVLPGDSQFWITRPYSWKSLLGAKALFILAFINLPMLLADGVIVRAYGLPLGAELPGLLWSQVLLTTCPGAQSCLWLREWRHPGDLTAMIRAYDFLDSRLRFVEELFTTPRIP